jgi:peptidoglycan/LPS O-acetylase OafA/YrhL
MIDKKQIYVMDGIAIICIVLYHSIPLYNSPDGSINNIYRLLNIYIGIFGLALFTFSSGFKLVLNHGPDLENKKFLKTYIVKRFFRLYKPYIGYTLLIAPILYLFDFFYKFFLINIIKIDFPAMHAFETTPTDFLLKFLIGQNIIAGHLWYLIVLLLITGFCFYIMYVSNLRVLFELCPILIITYMLYGDIVFSYSLTLYRVYSYSGLFIFGMFEAYLMAYNKKYYKNLLRFQSFLFIIFIILSIRYQSPIVSSYQIIVFGSLALPSFILLISDSILKFYKISQFILYIGERAFYIYLLHEPFIVPGIGLFLIGFLNIKYLVTPLIIAFFSILVAIQITKFLIILKINKFFE